ncbi:MAG: zinc-dependent alcohol dehydrogenase family protein [Fimbriimonas sp.]
MRRYVLGEAPGIDSWTLQEGPSPTLGPKDVRIRVRACSLNYRDLLVATGNYGGPWLPGLVPLSDGAGEVIEVGENVSRVTAGDRVAANFFRDWTEGGISQTKADTALGGALDGMLSEEVILPEHALVTLPSYLSFEEAACLPCAGLTAWKALFIDGRIGPSDTVLVQGTGGVSTFALQFAKLAGARVIATSSSDAKLERARELGADATINYRTDPAWDKAVRKLTDGRGVDLVIEVGGADTMGKSLRAAASNARIASIGFLGGNAVELAVGYLLTKNITLHGIYVGSVATFEAMNRALTLHELHPVVDRVFPFEAAPEALTYLQSGGHFGKIVVTL